ncbi:MAG: HlyC/CorC family transporter [Bacteroidaceae bacterium]|nr:HlyC/CorC family transporter [Bacteroidaceae bacterium]
MIDFLIIFVLVFINGFFCLAEVALISARRTKLQSEARAGSRAAKAALDLQADPDKYLSTCQIGITVVTILTGIYTGEALAGDFAAWLQRLGVAASLAPLLSKTIIVIVATYVQVELGELFPKRIGLDLADTLARAIAPFMLFLATLAKPAVWLLSKNTELLIHLFRLKAEDTHVTEAEVKSVIEEGTRAGELGEMEQDIMERVLYLGDQNVAGLMTHRGDLVTLDVAMSSKEVEAVLSENAFANYPVVDGSLGNTVGVASLKELVLIVGKESFDLRTIAREPTYLTESMSVYKALSELKKDRTNCGLVIDEFGEVCGLLALKDILEGLVGSIDDDGGVPDIIVRADGESWVVSGQCAVYDFLAYFDKEDLYKNDYTTVGGLFLTLLEHIPQSGEHIAWNGFTLQVAQMDGARIDKVVVRKELNEG